MDMRARIQQQPERLSLSTRVGVEIHVNIDYWEPVCSSND